VISGKRDCTGPLGLFRFWAFLALLREFFLREASARGFICDDPAVPPLFWPCGAVEDAEVVDATFRVLLRTPALGPATSPCAEKDEDAVLLPPSISVV